MKDIDEIRRDNMRLLEQEFGGPTPASKALDMSPSQFTNLRDGAKDSKTGKRRGMRKELLPRARRARVLAHAPQALTAVQLLEQHAQAALALKKSA